jgi:hypothetical protein
MTAPLRHRGDAVGVANLYAVSALNLGAFEMGVFGRVLGAADGR